MARRGWVLLLLPFVLAPGPRSQVSRRAPACPPGLAEDASRARAVAARLEGDEEARRLLPNVGRMCFGARVEPGITMEGVVLLPAAMPEVRMAARVAHLAAHRREGSPLAGAPYGDCARWVADAIEDEVRARAIEDRILAEAGVGGAAPFPRAELEAAYAARCAKERR